MTIAEIAEVEASVPLAENPFLTLGPGLELPPQQRSTSGPHEAEGVNRAVIVSGATPSGEEIVPDERAMTGNAMEGSVPGPAEETVAASADPEQGLIGAPSADNQAAQALAQAKLKVRDAQRAHDRSDVAACYENIDAAKDLVARSRAAIMANASQDRKAGTPPSQ